MAYTLALYDEATGDLLVDIPLTQEQAEKIKETLKDYQPGLVYFYEAYFSEVQST